MQVVHIIVNNRWQISSEARPANKQICNIKQRTTYENTWSITRYDMGYKTSGIRHRVIVWWVSDASREHSASIFRGSRYWHCDIFVNCSWVATRWQQYGTHLHTNSTQSNTKILEECWPCPISVCLTLAFALQLTKKQGNPPPSQGSRKSTSWHDEDTRTYNKNTQNTHKVRSIYISS